MEGWFLALLLAAVLKHFKNGENGGESATGRSAGAV